MKWLCGFFGMLGVGHEIGKDYMLLSLCIFSAARGVPKAPSFWLNGHGYAVDGALMRGGISRPPKRGCLYGALSQEATPVPLLAVIAPAAN
jgi:hypothetical protein